MNSVLKVSLLAATISFVVGCGPDKAGNTSIAVVAKEPVKLNTDDERAAYAIGTSFAKYLNTHLERPKEIGVELNKNLVLRGVEDVFSGESALKEEQIKEILQSFDGRIKTKMIEKNKKELEKAKADGEKFRTEFATKEGVLKTESGILYQVMTEGKGQTPKEEDTVKVHYRGTLPDGTQFDSSYDRKEPAVFPLNRVIAGWTEMLQLMTVGSKYKVVIPSELAYGDQGTGNIPAGSTLMFEIELLSIEAPKEKKAKKLK